MLLFHHVAFVWGTRVACFFQVFFTNNLPILPLSALCGNVKITELFF